VTPSTHEFARLSETCFFGILPGAVQKTAEGEKAHRRIPFGAPAPARKDCRAGDPVQIMHAAGTMQKMNTVVAVYGTHPQAEEALRAFQNTGFDMKKLSIVGKDYHTEEHVIGFYNTGDRMKFWGKRGAFWGTFWGMLFGSALFLIPGVGHIMVLGPLVGWIVGALGEGAVIGGLTALGAGLYSIGIPKDSILKYETALKADQFVVVAHGTVDDVTSAKRILERTGALSVDEHRASGTV
jgi:hypothetical protein